MAKWKCWDCEHGQIVPGMNVVEVNGIKYNFVDSGWVCGLGFMKKDKNGEPELLPNECSIKDKVGDTNNV